MSDATVKMPAAGIVAEDSAMPSAFPGMDPYLEKPGLWRDVHHGFISTVHDLLNAQVRPSYFVRICERVFIEDESVLISGRRFQPSYDEIREAFLKVINLETRDVTTVIDLEIDYRKEPDPPLDAELAAWADDMLRSKGLR